MVKALSYSPSSIVVLPNVFGTGVGGDVTISGTVTLTGEVSYRNLTILAGGILITNGVRVLVSNKLVNNGTIHNDGAAASGMTAGAAAPAWTEYNGGAGGTGRNTVGNGAVGTVCNSKFDDSHMLGGSAPGAAGGSGGFGGNATNSSGGEDVRASLSNIVNLFSGSIPFQGGVLNICGGSGGGSGGLGTGGVGASGGGGGGGGVVFISARILVNNGVIRANGGAGANATGSGNIGGGSGGGGGMIILIGTVIIQGTLTANGGAEGTSTGTCFGSTASLPGITVVMQGN